MKRAVVSGLRRSSVRHWNLVSRLASVTPLGSRGSGVAEALRTVIESGIISKPFLAILDSLTRPRHRMTSSGCSAETASSTSFVTLFLGVVTWTMPSLFRSRTKLIPPSRRTS